MASWHQIKEAKEENRHELLITGKELVKELSLSDGILDNSIFTLTQLNYLRLSSSTLSSISEDIGNLSNLGCLELQDNKLTSLPKSIGKLNKLKLLDVSDNQLETLPMEMNNLTSLTSFIGRNNALTELISFDNCPALASIDIRHNQISDFQVICHDKIMLSEFHAASNKIESIPTEIVSLTNLKILNLSENLIKEVPGELNSCIKLKELSLKGNPLSDRRFKKLVESDRGFSKTVLDYIRQHFQISQGKSASANAKDKKNKKNIKKNEDKEIDRLCNKMSVLSAKDDLTVKIDSEIKDIRGHIVCCILRNIDLSGNKLKRFISIQTKLHETICEKRNVATIATHDLAKVVGPLHYCAKSPKAIVIHPLNKSGKVTGYNFFKSLRDEAETIRKQMKRNTYSGIHKYLYLVEGWQKWPCLVDSNGTVISFPPITNAEDTKISPETTDVFVEVTSSSSLNKAKEVVEALLLASIEAELPVEVSENGKSTLTVEQVRILNEQGNLKMVYPSRTDLVFEDDQKIAVIRA